jgi:hypothetical protein
MLTQPLLQQLHELRLHGMAAALEQQLTTLASNELNFEERLGLLIQHELIEGSSPHPPASAAADSRSPLGLAPPRRSTRLPAGRPRPPRP